MPALMEFGYGDVTVDSALHRAQLQNTHDVLMNLSEDSLLKPFRQMVGQPAPGDDLGDALRTLRGASDARIEINGQRWSGSTEPGSFAAVARRWRDGERLELELPRRLRLDPVALLCGPLVLFAISAGSERPRPRRTSSWRPGKGPRAVGRRASLPLP